MRLKSISILSILFFICSCNDRQPENLEVSKIMPIKEGNIWTYRNIDFLSEQIDTISMGVGEMKSIKGHEGYVFNENYLFRNDDEGNAILIGGFTTKDEMLTESLFLKKNIKKGESYDFQNILINTDIPELKQITVHQTCFALDTMIETPAGLFKSIAFEYSSRKGSDIIKIYASIDVGVVKNEHFEFGKLLSTRELISYRLK